MVDELNIYRIIWNNIKELRTLEGLSQEKLAERTGKSAHFISVLERGESGLSVPTLIEICKALKVDTNSIFVGGLDNSVIPTDNLLNKTFESLNDVDRDMVTYLLNYIVNTKK